VEVIGEALLYKKMTFDFDSLIGMKGYLETITEGRRNKITSVACDLHVEHDSSGALKIVGLTYAQNILASCASLKHLILTFRIRDEHCDMDFSENLVNSWIRPKRMVRQRTLDAIVALFETSRVKGLQSFEQRLILEKPVRGYGWVGCWEREHWTRLVRMRNSSLMYQRYMDFDGKLRDVLLRPRGYFP